MGFPKYFFITGIIGATVHGSESRGFRFVSFVNIFSLLKQVELPRLTEISVTRGSKLTVRFRFVFSRFRCGSGLYFFNYKRVKSDILTGKSYKI